MKHPRRHFFPGYSLIEILIALAIFSMLTSAVLTLLFSDRFASYLSTQSQAAAHYAEEGAEATRMMHDQNWASLVDGTHGLVKSGSNWIFQGTSDTRNSMTRQIVVTTRSPNSKVINSKVTYSGIDKRPVTLNVPIMLTNWRNALVYSEEAVPFPTGDWTRPVLVTTADVTPSGSSGTDVYADNNMVYLITSNPSIDKTDLHLFNVSNPASPVLLSAIDLGIKDAIQLAKRGNFLYVINNDTTNQVSVVDVSNPVSPVKVANLNISMMVKAKSVVATSKTILVGLENNIAGAEVYSLSIDPLNPQILGSAEIGGNVNKMAAWGSEAALATSVDNKELQLVTWNNPAQLGLSVSCDATGTEDGISIFMGHHYRMYLGRAVAGTQEITQYDSSCNIFATYEAGVPVNDILVGGWTGYAVTTGPSNFRVMNFNNTPFTRIEAPGADLSFPQEPAALAIYNNYIYVAMRSNATLRIVTSTP